nr:ribosomal protein L16, mitochondrial [Tanacetum cinerariifolium]
MYETLDLTKHVNPGGTEGSSGAGKADPSASTSQDASSRSERLLEVSQEELWRNVDRVGSETRKSRVASRLTDFSESEEDLSSDHPEHEGAALDDREQADAPRTDQAFAHIGASAVLLDGFQSELEIHRPRWDRRIDKGNRDNDRDHTEKQKNFVRKIDYAPTEVSTRYGISGVKVRISYSQKEKGRARRAIIGQFHRTMSGKFRRNGKIWVRVLADLPITGKPTEVRMGRGKGNPAGWIARVSTRQIPFEMDGVSLSNARQAATLAAHKLCASTKFVQWS